MATKLDLNIKYIKQLYEGERRKNQRDSKDQKYAKLQIPSLKCEMKQKKQTETINLKQKQKQKNYYIPRLRKCVIFKIIL